MKLGLLGIDARIAQVAAAAVARGDVLAVGCDLPDSAPLGPSAVIAAVPRDGSWATLLDPLVCDAVLVGADGWSDTRSEAVRGLVQAGRTLLLSHPLVLSMLWAYELDMIRGDSSARLIPFLPDRLHPFIRRLRGTIETGMAGADPNGPVETIVMERRMTDRSRNQVLRALAADADLVRVLVGDPSRLSTLGAADPESAWNTLSVGFSGAAVVPVRWQVAGGGSPGGLRITLVQPGGPTVVEIPDDRPGGTEPWTWTSPGGRSEAAAFERGGTMLAVLHGHSIPAADPAPEPNPEPITPASWADAARATELAETVPRSLARGRAIDLHQEEFSELGTFRGTMASLGCGLVLVALFVLVLATLVGGIAREAGWEWGERLAGIWPQVVLAALGLFLALQVLPLLVGQNTPPPSAGDATPSAPRE